MPTRKHHSPVSKSSPRAYIPQSNPQLHEAHMSTSVSFMYAELPRWLFLLLTQETQILLQVLSWLSFNTNQLILNIKAHHFFIDEKREICAYIFWTHKAGATGAGKRQA